MTAPEMGNVGCNPEDEEARRAFLTGLVVRELSPRASNWRSRESLSEHLAREGVVGLAGVDTRALTRKLRTLGMLRGLLSTDKKLSDSALIDRCRATPGLEGRDLVREVSSPERYRWTDPSWSHPEALAERRQLAHHVVAYDFGIKRNILRRLVDFGCRVTVVPAATPAADVLALRPDGVFLSNGPGDPAAVPYAALACRALLDAGLPLFGICLGHQILGLALGGTTYKLKFGHHGANQPVIDLATQKVEITSQNHGFAVDVASMKGKAELSHVNLNDGTVEGMHLPGRPVFSVQYHPEASPGPHDASYLFDRFVQHMDHHRR
jgi:carbamoyl-phosphate synthase small subunit